MAKKKKTSGASSPAGAQPPGSKVSEARSSETTTPRPAPPVPSSVPAGSSSLPPPDTQKAPAASAGELNKPYLLIVLAILLLAGLGFAAHLTRLHIDLFYGEKTGQSLCDFGSGWSCSEVNASSYSTLFGFLPIALLAIPVYSLMLMLTLRARSLKEQASLGLIASFGLLATLYSLVLAYISKFVLGSFCLFCVSMYVVNLAALIIPILVSNRGFVGTLKSSLEVFTNRRLLVLASFNVVLIGALAWGGYSAARDTVIQRTAQSILSQPARPAQPQPTQGGSPDKVKRAPGERANVPIDDTIPFKGSPKAKVTIVTYEDFQCGFCKRLAGNLAQLVERYPEDVRVGFRHFPMHQDCNEGGIKRSMHPDACAASVAAECARGQGKFWEYHDLLWKSFGHLTPADLNSYATAVGLDLDAFGQCRAAPAALEKVRADSRTGGALGVSGTPTFFLNGRELAGGQSLEVLSALVEAELKGQELTMAELREIPPLPDVLGQVKAPEMVQITGPDGPFEIDAFEASLSGKKAASVGGARPATQLSWFDADQACKAVGKRLCTEGEWLTACSGAVPIDRNRSGDYTDDLLTGSEYPYGDFYKAGLCSDQARPPKDLPPDQPPPVPELVTGNHPQCGGKFGVYDLTGSVREWVGTVPNKAAYMGGAFFSQADASCISRNTGVGPYYTSENTGFRCCRGGNPQERVTHPGRQVGQRLTAFTLPTLEGKPFKSDSMKGKPYLLTFWASWCPNCKQELPALAAIYPELKAMGFEIISVNTDDDPEKAQKYLENTPLPFPVVLDTGSRLLHEFDSVSLPTSYIVNKQGMIAQRRVGYDKGDDKRLKTSAEKLVKE